MAVDYSRLILPAVSTVMVAIWLFLAFRHADDFEDMIESIDSDQYRFPELFSIGFSIMKLFHFSSNSYKARKRMKEIAEVYGPQYAEYHYYILNGAKWTYGFTLFTLFSVFGAMAGSLLAVFIGAVMAFLLMWYLDELLNDKLEEKRDLLLNDFPQILTKMALLVNSGMTVREAWKKSAEGSNRPLFREMKVTVEEMENGMTELQAYDNFANRCAIKEIRRFSATISQTLQKGNAEIATFLKELADEMWQEKRNRIKQKSEAADSKMIIPLGLIFIGILGMVMVPVLSGMSL